ncbi:MAG: hypothetical protein NWF05_05320 [Candidatus Bathyarchaeota archaeon]|nr:hypothetical protein [Candidatus Bathyarchaeota archaeon]
MMKRSNESKIRINTVVIGEPAEWLNEWKRRGLVTSYTDAIIQALRVFNEKLTEQDLKAAQLGNLQNIQ